MDTSAVASWEYKNDFFSITIHESEHRPGSYIFSSGISMPRFDPICWGKTGICSNPAFKGLQLLRADVSHFALQRGIVTKNAVSPCDSTGGHGDGWYQENALLIEDASPEAVREILEFSARDLVQTVLTACYPDVKVPAGSLDPEEMQRFLESLNVPNYRELAPPPIAKPQAAA
ncbi:MAG TPA: hypothetical protein VL197_10865 [Nitrospirota bacterium]|nr:hypothetical protein [Nitrospirota bacterium]